MATFTDVHPAFCPTMPDRVEDLGIPRSLVQDLVLRRLYVSGTSSCDTLGRALKLSPLVIESIFRDLREQKLVEVLGMIGNDYSFTLGGNGRKVAAERFELCQYCGPAPVSLEAYAEAARAQAARVRIDRMKLRHAFSDLVVTDKLLDQLGPAIISHKSMFLYGPTGNGKTSIAERLMRVYTDCVRIPYAVEVDSQIILLYDPVVHQLADLAESEDDADPRWVTCKRPLIITGGELVSGMLELKIDEGTGVYVAPIQMKANNGVFVIDDFGRQLVSPRELLNRWIVPLDRRVDYLTLRHGVKFQIPFELMVVFSTNLDPSQLADEAFLRRLQNKVFIEPVSEPVFDEIFRRVTAARNLSVDPDCAAHLRALCARSGHAALYACYPNDICRIVTAINNYEGRPPQLTKADLERAVDLYFSKQ